MQASFRTTHDGQTARGRDNDNAMDRSAKLEKATMHVSEKCTVHVKLCLILRLKLLRCDQHFGIHPQVLPYETFLKLY